MLTTCMLSETITLLEYYESYNELALYMQYYKNFCKVNRLGSVKLIQGFLPSPFIESAHIFKIQDSLMNGIKPLATLSQF